MKIIIHARREGSWDYTECGRETIHAESHSREFFKSLGNRYSKYLPRCKVCLRKVKSVWPRKNYERTRIYIR